MTSSCSASVQQGLSHVASLDVGISEVGVDSKFESVSPMRSKPSPPVLLSMASEPSTPPSMKETSLSLGGGLVVVWRRAGRSGVTAGTAFVGSPTCLIDAAFREREVSPSSVSYTHLTLPTRRLV